MKRALITGITGQDGSYLAEFLLEKGYEVHGIKRRASLFNTQRIDHIYEDPHVEDSRFRLHYGDLTDSSNLTRILSEVQPDEIYNLGAQSHVAVSFERPNTPPTSMRIGTLRLLEAIRFLGLRRKPASIRRPPPSSTAWSRKSRRRKPRRFTRARPMRVAKLYAYWITVNYREAYGMYACNGILFNHEVPAPRRNLRHPQDHPGVANIAPGPRSLPLPRQHGLAPRLGPRQGLRPHAVDDAPAGRARRFRHRHRQTDFRARIR